MPTISRREAGPLRFGLYSTHASGKEKGECLGAGPHRRGFALKRGTFSLHLVVCERVEELSILGPFHTLFQTTIDVPGSLPEKAVFQTSWRPRSNRFLVRHFSARHLV